MKELIVRSKRRSLPQIFVGEQIVGGYDDLVRLNATGGLEQILIAECDQTSVVKQTSVIS